MTTIRECEVDARSEESGGNNQANDLHEEAVLRRHDTLIKSRFGY